MYAKFSLSLHHLPYLSVFRCFIPVSINIYTIISTSISIIDRERGIFKHSCSNKCRTLFVILI